MCFSVYFCLYFTRAALTPLYHLTTQFVAEEMQKFSMRAAVQGPSLTAGRGGGGGRGAGAGAGAHGRKAASPTPASGANCTSNTSTTSVNVNDKDTGMAVADVYEEYSFKDLEGGVVNPIVSRH